MATLVKTPSGTWKALIRKNGWSTVAKTFRTKRDAEDWSRRTEEEMVRGVYIRRSGSEKMTLSGRIEALSGLIRKHTEVIRLDLWSTP